LNQPPGFFPSGEKRIFFRGFPEILSQILPWKQAGVTLAWNKQAQGRRSQPESTRKSFPPLRQLGIRPALFTSHFFSNFFLTKKFSFDMDCPYY
jgi:hypothetical protein